MARLDRVIQRFETPEDAERATRQAYRAMTGNERVALTVELRRRYFAERDDIPERLPRVLAVTERS